MQKEPAPPNFLRVALECPVHLAQSRLRLGVQVTQGRFDGGALVGQFLGDEFPIGGRVDGHCGVNCVGGTIRQPRARRVLARLDAILKLSRLQGVAVERPDPPN